MATSLLRPNSGLVQPITIASHFESEWSCFEPILWVKPQVFEECLFLCLPPPHSVEE